jgi:hypothetical protein
MGCLSGPELHVTSAANFDLTIRCFSAVKYRSGGSEYRFELKYRLIHPTGYFEYFVEDLCFEPANFSTFADALREMQLENTDGAKLANVGMMFAFELQRIQLRLRATVHITESVAGAPRLDGCGLRLVRQSATENGYRVSCGIVRCSVRRTRMNCRNVEFSLVREGRASIAARGRS